MAATKLYDLAVKVGEYQDRDGNTKGRYENVGAVMRSDNGQFLMLKRTFNPAGVPGDRDTVLVSCFEPKSNQRGGGSQRPDPSPGGYSNTSQRSETYGTANPSYDTEDIPFAPEVRI